VLTTDDLFLAGLALSRGCQLSGLDVRGTNGRRVAVFRIAGPEAEAAETDYFSGQETSVNVQLLKLQVRRLKERAFAALREEEEIRHADPFRDRGFRPGASADAQPHRSRRR
jgi:hypothetical protein